MKSIQLIEHGRLHRWPRQTDPPPNTERAAYLPARLYDRLQKHDLRRPDGSVFVWSRAHASAGQWVGVIRAPGLALELLPKIDRPTGTGGSAASVRKNLLYMLRVARMVPVRQVDIARLEHRDSPLLETLIRVFAYRLRAELRRGFDRRYVQREHDLRAFKGKLLVGEQVRRFAAHRERFRCRFDEFTTDTPMNRVIRFVVRRLLSDAHSTATTDALHRCLVLMDDVSDVEVTLNDLDRVVLDRNNERFEDILNFCRLVLQGHTPSARSGAMTTYSLLFDMNIVFERFIANFLRRRVLPTVDNARLHTQGGPRKRALMRSRTSSRGVLQLKPDLLIHVGDRPLVIDTKWKQVGDGHRTRASGADLYQLFAYTKRFSSPRSVLLYPHHAGFRNECLDVLDASEESPTERVELRSVNLSRDLSNTSGRDALAAELRSLVLGEASATA